MDVGPKPLPPPGRAPLGPRAERQTCLPDGQLPSKLSETGCFADMAGRIPGARHLALEELLVAGDPEVVRALVGAPPGTEVVAYCHSGNRSGMAIHVLTAAGYRARNYEGSWHEWSRDPSLPAELGR